VPESKPNSFQWKIGGEAGFGIQVSGLLFAKVCARAGLSVFDYAEYPSLIRGGHNTLQVRVSGTTRVRAPERTVDLLVALNAETVVLHKRELATHAALLFDSDAFSLDARDLGRPDVVVYPVPLTQLAREGGGFLALRNTVAVGATLALLEAPVELLTDVIAEVFGAKGEAVVKADADAARRGFAYVRAHYDTKQFPHHLAPVSSPPSQLVVTGNEAVGLGAIAGGLGFYAAYPMTPASSLLHFFAAHAPQFGLVVKHAEDELGVINMAIGASHAGARVLCGTSGGGFSLMAEALGMAAMTETPLVVFEGMRGGPSTGLPTWTEQGDLRFVLHAGQGDFPRLVFAPGDVEECFHLTHLALNAADRYQTPVILLSDKFLAESHESVAPFALDRVAVDRGIVLSADEVARLAAPYRRYAITEDGISPRVLPGTPGGVFTANSDEHDEEGLANEAADLRVRMHDKRLRKSVLAARELPEPEPVGPEDAPLLLTGFGSTKGALFEAQERLARDGVSARVLHVNRVAPFPVRAVEAAFRHAKATMVVEGNATGQFESLIREHTGYQPTGRFRKYDGRPVYPSEIEAAAAALASAHG
jgi:2-oxoglutarate ferredoxin oxidoreductase subunit alpha